MLFNSYLFIFLFLPLSLLGWYGFNHIGKYRLAQGYLIGMSLWFYGYYNVSCLLVIAGSCAFNYLVSWLFTRCKKKPPFILALFVNIGSLCVFKYYNFFVDNVNAAFSYFSLAAGSAGASVTLLRTREILLPLGISFLTFVQLSFVTDRYRGQLEHCELLHYLSFVTFFPCLISGPIVQHGETISQFKDLSRRSFQTDRFLRGIHRFTLGLGKKVLLADTLALVVDTGYGDIASLDSLGALIVAVGYTLELYFDFSGYSDMAIGTGWMFGIDLPENFRSPYKAASVKEFWKRWHISLSSFLQTYVYIPLGGSRRGKVRTYVNTMLTFLVSGLWHGASWTYVLWGLLHGIGVSLAGIFSGKGHGKGPMSYSSHTKAAVMLSRLRHAVCVALTFAYVCAAFVFFRADTIADGAALLGRLLTGGIGNSVVSLAAAMEPSEIYIVTKALSLIAPSYVGAVQVVMLLIVYAVSFLVLTKRPSQELCLDSGIGKRGVTWLAVLFVWSVISMSGVTTFVYFNF